MCASLAEISKRDLVEEVLEHLAKLTVGFVGGEALAPCFLSQLVVVRPRELNHAEHSAVGEEVIRCTDASALLKLQEVDFRVAVGQDADAVSIDVEATDQAQLAIHGTECLGFQHRSVALALLICNVNA